MKKRMIISTIMVAGLLLLASCGEKEGIGIQLPEKNTTPTPIVVPTCTPTATPTGKPGTMPSVTQGPEPTKAVEPSKTPTPEPTEAVEPTQAPTEAPVPSPEPTEIPTPTVTPEPTREPVMTPEPTQVPEPTTIPEPDVEPTKAPEETPTPAPTEVPGPTEVPNPTEPPQETVTPEPTIDPKPLVYKGWQQTVSIDEEYLIIFPDMFRGSTVERTETELRTVYTCAEDSRISFRISYIMQTTLEEYADKVLDAEGAAVKILPEEGRMEFQWQEKETIYRGILLESRYAKELLGTGFGEEEWITGVMKVVFSYPEEYKNDYETVTYSYFVVDNGEE